MKFVFSLLRKPFDFILRKLGVIRSPGNNTQSPHLSRSVNFFNSILSPFESYVVSVQSLLIWEKPRFSALAFFWVNAIFWLLVSWNRRFYSILCLIGMLTFLWRTWVKQVLPELRAQQQEDYTESWISVHPQVLSVPEISHYLNDICRKVKLCCSDVWQLRQENRGLFCFLMCAVFMLTALIGYLIPGVLVIYSIVLVITLGPGIILHLIPVSLYDHVAGFLAEEAASVKKKAVKRDTSADTDSDLDEFLPESTPETLRQLSLRQDSQDPLAKYDTEGSSSESPIADSLVTIRELGMESFISEGDDSSMYKGLGIFPSVEEENESEAEDVPETLEDVPEKLDDEDKNGIHFVLTHFKEESSESESEAMFSEGLSFGAIEDSSELPGSGSVRKSTPKDDKSKQLDSKKSQPSTKDTALCDIDDDVLADFEILDDETS